MLAFSKDFSDHSHQIVYKYNIIYKEYRQNNEMFYLALAVEDSFGGWFPYRFKVI